MKKIESIRQKITSLDKRIISLLDVRFDLVKEIGSIKRKKEIPITQKQREKEIIDIIAKLSSNNDNEKMILSVYKKIFENSKKAQQ